jgi:hypothetical protein
LETAEGEHFGKIWTGTLLREVISFDFCRWFAQFPAEMKLLFKPECFAVFEKHCFGDPLQLVLS